MTLAMWPLTFIAQKKVKLPGARAVGQWNAPMGAGIGVAPSPRRPISERARGARKRAGGSQLVESHVAMALGSALGTERCLAQECCCLTCFVWLCVARGTEAVTSDKDQA